MTCNPPCFSEMYLYGCNGSNVVFLDIVKAIAC